MNAKTLGAVTHTHTHTHTRDIWLIINKNTSNKIRDG